MAFLKKPYRSLQKHSNSPRNIFQDSLIQPLSSPKNDFAPKLPQVFDYVGPAPIRDKIITQVKQHNKPLIDSLDQLQVQKRNQTIPQTLTIPVANTTIRSKMTLSKVKQQAKDIKNLKYFKQYQQKWQQQMIRLKQSTGKNKTHQPTLLQTVHKQVVVVPNPQKQDILKYYVQNYWQMSLRNNSVILKRHLKGNNRYQRDQQQMLLQSIQGTKEVESSIPKLPLEQLGKLQLKDLSLSGRNKLASQSYSCDPSIVSQYTSRLSNPSSMRSAFSMAGEVLKMEYQSKYRYLEKDAEN